MESAVVTVLTLLPSVDVQPRKAESPQLTPVVFMDVDGVLNRGDSRFEFLHRVSPSRISFCWSVLRAGLDSLLRRRFSRDAVKECVVARILVGGTRYELQDIGRCLAQEMVSERFLEDAAAAISEHRAVGAKIVLVSASLDLYLEPLREFLGVDGLLCTKVEFDAMERATGRFVGESVRPARKLELSAAWLNDHGLDRTSCDVTVYGHGGGAAFREWADEGFVRSRRFLRRTGAFL